MSILTLVLSAMLALTPAKYRPTEDSARMVTYQAIAEDISAAVDDPMTGLPFDGPAAKEASALALVAIARNESHYRDSVRTCKEKGDSGKSISVFQLFKGPSRHGYSEAQICADPVLAARLGLYAFTYYAHSSSPLQMFQGYAAGDSKIKSDASKRQNRFFQDQLAANNIRLTRKPGNPKFVAEFGEPMVVSSNTDGTPLRVVTVASR